MNRILLALACLALPVTAVSSFAVPSYAATITELGDLSPLTTIASDTLGLVGKGNMTAAAARITDFESAWDAEASTLRALSSDKWGIIDDASDRAIAAVRTNHPVASEATAAVTALISVLESPTAPVASIGVATAVTDANGRPLPCEDLLAAVRSTMTTSPPAAADQARVDELEGKGIERCNADDDKRADDFFAQALALMGK
tara:strand:- start:2207 stop:2812 length:606 start_codon:yes stop_codon:yes gene_type:complete